MAFSSQPLTKSDLADLLERFVGGVPACGDWEWDDFISARASPELEPYRQRLLAEVDPPKGIDAVQEMIRELRTNA